MYQSEIDYIYIIVKLLKNSNKSIYFLYFFRKIYSEITIINIYVQMKSKYIFIYIIYSNRNNT